MKNKKLEKFLPYRHLSETSNRREFLARSAGYVGAFAAAGLLDRETVVGRALAQADPVNPVPEKAIPPSPIELSWFLEKHRTCSVRMKSRMFSPAPELVLNIESCTIATMPGADPPAPSPSAALTFHAKNNVGISVPFCNVDAVQENKVRDGIELILRGRLDSVDELPFVLRLRLTAEAYRVKVKAEMLKLPQGVNLLALCPDLQCDQFAAQNHPPFEMARQSFVFLEGKGVSWISDAQRWASEIHDEEGPWIQCFRTKQFAQDRIDVLLRAYKEDFTRLYGRSLRDTEDVAASPLVGWVARDNAYMVAIAGKNAYEVGTRWVPCLHSNMAAEVGTGGLTLPFETRIYILPVAMEMLQKMYGEDFAGGQSSRLLVPEDALWPYTPGIPLGSFEGDDLASWRVAGGRLTAYGNDDVAIGRSNQPMKQDARRRVWITDHAPVNGRRERATYPEGVTEGKGSALWEVPSREGKATLSRPLRLSEPITHVAVDAINRGKSDVEIEVMIEENRTMKGNKVFLLRPSSNRRFLVPLREKVGGEKVILFLKVNDHRELARIVLDNLRGFRVP